MYLPAYGMIIEHDCQAEIRETSCIQAKIYSCTSNICILTNLMNIMSLCAANKKRNIWRGKGGWKYLEGEEGLNILPNLHMFNWHEVCSQNNRQVTL